MREQNQGVARTAAVLLWSLLLAACLAHAAGGGAANSNVIPDDDNHEPHPDPNEEDYENMVYIGRHHDHDDDDEEHESTQRRRRRMGFEHDNGVRYIFGTSFDASHKNIAEEELAHLPHHPDDLPDRLHDIQTRHELKRKQQQQQRQKNKKPVGPKPFGFVHTHPLDGGVTPPVAVRVDPFFMDTTLVTNQQFAKFVTHTHYETEAEQYGWSFVLASFVPQQSKSNEDEELEVDPEAPHWVALPDATWRQPEGPGSSYKHREQHPVVHVSHKDAAEYCHWVGKRLPGEREWEAAARWSGHTGHAINDRTLYIWGDPEDISMETTNTATKPDITTLDPNVVEEQQEQQHPHYEKLKHTDHALPPHMNLTNEWARAAKYANLWGPSPFPWENNAHDGWRGTSPVQTYPPNAAGIYDLTGNVWEWMRGGKHKARIVRGASYVDSLLGDVNHAATVGARDTVHGTTTTGNIGFRCVRSPVRRVQHHWKWHDEEEHGPLAVQDQYGNTRHVATAAASSSSSSSYFDNEDEFYQDDDDLMPRRKKKKVVKKRERISTEL